MQKVKILVMDVDGTMTDGKIYIGSDGEAMKAFNVHDGYGIGHLLPYYEIIPVVITGRKSVIVHNRCLELGIEEVYQNISDKKQVLCSLAKKKGVEYREISYFGDDLNDYECMKMIQEQGGVVGCPSNAVKQIKSFVDYITEKKGGEGAVREFIEWIIEQNLSE